VAAPLKGPIELITNNFRIKSQNHGIIYTYRVDFIDGQAAALIESSSNPAGTTVNPDTDQVSNVSRGSLGQLETFQKYKIINAHTHQLKQIFLQFVFVGSNLFSTSEFDSQITLETTAPFYGRYYTIVIEKCSAFLLDDLNNSKMEDHPIALSFINSIIKNSLRNSQLRQIGRNPRFFMPARAKVFQSQVETWPGFFTSSWIFQRGLYLIIDNISKFLSVDNCLSLIQDRLQRYDQNFVNREFEGAIVMAKYGPHRTYKVHQIKWNMNPKDYIFDHGDEKARTNMIDYFLTAYQVKINSVNQPLFEIRQKRQNIYLPPELCTLVGIPAKIRENKKVMADIRQSLFQKPHERIASIKELNRMISDSKEVKEWNLDINLEPDTIEANVLKRPQIF